MALTFVSDDVAVAIGEDVLLRSVDRGATWAPVEAPVVADELIVGTHDTFVVAGAEGTVRVARGTWQAVEDVEPANTFYALSPGGRWLVGSDGEIRVNVDEALERVDYTVFQSPTEEDLRAIDGGFDWAVAVGEDGAIVSIETALVAYDGTVCP